MIGGEKYWQFIGGPPGFYCGECGKSLASKRRDSKFCSTECRHLNSNRVKGDQDGMAKVETENV